MNNPKVTVIISTYASTKYIIGCIESLISQTWFDQIEVLIMDSGSPEDEYSLVKPYLEKYSQFIYVRTQRETLYGAWSRAWQMAKGQYLINCNTDDRLSPFAIEKLASWCVGSRHHRLG